MEVTLASKIHIIGGSGSGKSWLAQRLSSHAGLPHYDLDDLFWDNSGTYGVRRKAESRDQMLQEIVQTDAWCTEGVYYAWTGSSFARADRILLLDMPGWICRLRIVRRFLKRRIGLAPGKKETLRSLWALLKWTKQFQQNNLPEIRAALAQYPDKTLVLHSRREIRNYLKSVGVM